MVVFATGYIGSMPMLDHLVTVDFNYKTQTPCSLILICQSSTKTECHN